MSLRTSWSTTPGSPRWARSLRSSPEAELNLIEVDVAAVVDLCSRFVPSMVKRGRGAVLNVASVGAFGPVPGQASYGAAKAFVLSYTQAMREELKRHRSHGRDVVPRAGVHRLPRGRRYSRRRSEKVLPKFLWQHADAVAKAAVDGMASGKGVIVPGMPTASRRWSITLCRAGCCCR